MISPTPRPGARRRPTNPLGRKPVMRPIFASLIAVPVALGSLPALAQNSPSAEQIIQQLKPSGDLLKGNTRGIRLANPSAGGEAKQAPAGTATAAAAAPV